MTKIGLLLFSLLLIACQPSVTSTAASLPTAEILVTPDPTLIMASQDIELPDEGAKIGNLLGGDCGHSDWGEGMITLLWLFSPFLLFSPLSSLGGRREVLA